MLVTRQNTIFLSSQRHPHSLFLNPPPGLSATKVESATVTLARHAPVARSTFLSIDSFVAASDGETPDGHGS